MRKLFTAAFILAAFSGKAQNVGINTTTPNSNAALDITATDKGILIPRLSTSQRNGITSPANGLMIYDSTVNNFYYYNGAAWNPVGGSGGPSLQLLADKFGGTGEAPPISTSTTPVTIAFNHVISTPTGGNTWTGSNTFTVGAGQGGVYMIQARLHGPDATPATNTVSYSLTIQVNGNSYGNPGNVYGIYPSVDAYTPSGTKARGEIIAYIKLEAGDTIKLLAIGANSGVSPPTVSPDAGSSIMIIKIN